MSLTRTITGISYADAIKEINAGKKVTRLGWNREDTYIWLLPKAEIPKAEIPKAWIKDPILLSIYEEEHVDILVCEAAIRYKTTYGSVLTGWQPSQIDLLSEDWYVIE